MSSHDGSEGDPTLFGWEGTKEFDAAGAWLQRRPNAADSRSGGIGFSVRARLERVTTFLDRALLGSR